MSYYTVLSATSALLHREDITVRRCRRRFNGPHRYILHDAKGGIFHFDEKSRSRRMGYTLQELLEWLSKRPNADIASQARTLINDLDDWYQIKTAS